MLRDDINNAIKDAMKAKEERKLSTLRMVNSTLKNSDIEARGQGKPPLSDEDILGVLPKQMSDDEVKAAIAAAIKETGAAGMKDMGKVIGVLRGKFAGQMDFGKASGMVKAALAG